MRLGAAVLVTMMAAGCTEAFADVVETTRHEIKVGAGAKLVVDSDGGGVEVKPGAAGVVKIEARRHAASKEDALGLDVQTASSGGAAKVSYHNKTRKNQHVDFVIEAPADARLDLNTGGGGISASGFGAGVQANTGGGGITLTALKGDVRARSGGGGITVKQIDGTLQAETGGGGVNVEATHLRGANKIATGGGGITCAVPANARLTVEGSTGGGGVHNDFGLPAQDGSMRGTLGDGKDGSLELTTGGGGISLKKN
jgi:hypothetical protein